MRLCRDRLKGGLPTHRTVYLSFVICVIIKNIFLLAGFLEPIMTSAALKSLSAVGNILIFCVGTNLFGLPHVRIANLLPALVIAVAWELV